MNQPTTLTLWQRIQKIGHTIGDFQARLLLTILYTLLIVPVGFALRFSEDTLQLRVRPINGSYWQNKQALDTEIRLARRQG